MEATPTLVPLVLTQGSLSSPASQRRAHGAVKEQKRLIVGKLPAVEILATGG